jgi:hypothetical protein
LKADYRTNIGPAFRTWALGRAKERRFSDAHLGLSMFAAAPSVKVFLAENAKQLSDQYRAEVRAIEDEFHYTQIVELFNAPVAAEDRLTQHINAYLALVDPPGKMLAEVQKLAEYRQWLKEGRPAKAVVKIEWGPRVPGREQQVEIVLGSGKESQTFTRTVAAEPGRVWVETIPVKGIAGGYRVKTSRATLPVEELVEATKQRTELFLSDPAGPLTVASEIESGTRVTVEWVGVVSKPALPAWTKPDKSDLTLPMLK